jgi:hypothetical protein
MKMAAMRQDKVTQKNWRPWKKRKQLKCKRKEYTGWDKLKWLPWDKKKATHIKEKKAHRLEHKNKMVAFRQEKAAHTIKEKKVHRLEGTWKQNGGLEIR